MRALFLASLTLGLAACAAPEPLVDRMNVSDAKYTADLKSCRDESSGGWIPFTGGSVSDCMKGKGYRVLMSNTGL